MPDAEGLRAALVEGRPYFGEALVADQGHREHEFFPMLVHKARESRGGNFAILEVGSWAGASLVAWDKAAEGRAALVAVDKWDPGPHAVDPQEVEKLFWHNMRASGVIERLTLVRGDSREVLPVAFTRDFYDIVYLDGGHRRDVVLADITNAMPLVRDGGILCGDDLERELADVDGPAHAEAIKTGIEHAHGPDGVGYHPGVTQAVHEVFGKVSRFGRLWAMQKKGEVWTQISRSI